MSEITISEFSRRICAANHTIHDVNPSRPVPCPIHVQIARQSWGLIQLDGGKTLGAILATALERGVKPEFKITVAGVVRESHMEGDTRMVDKIEVTHASVSAAEVRHERLSEGYQIELEGGEQVTIPHG